MYVGLNTIAFMVSAKVLVVPPSCFEQFLKCGHAIKLLWT